MQRGPVRETRTRRYDHFFPAPFSLPFNSRPSPPLSSQFCRSAAVFFPSLTANHPFRVFPRSLSLLVRRRILVHLSLSRLLLLSFSLCDDARSSDVNAAATDRPYLRRPWKVLSRERRRERNRPLTRARRTYCYRNERPADKRSPPWMTNERVPLA